MSESKVNRYVRCLRLCDPCVQRPFAEINFMESVVALTQKRAGE
jgi:hypothetical protein